jgi:hypothetical protein
MLAVAVKAAIYGTIVLASASTIADTLHLTDDTYTRQDKVTENNGAQQVLQINDKVAGKERVGFARFDLTPLPDGIMGADIEKATLRVWVEKVGQAGDINFVIVQSPWDESTLTAGLAAQFPPGIPVVDTLSVTSADVENFVTVDVTEAMRSWVDGTHPNNGLEAMPVGVEVELGSKETDKEHEMQIEVALVSVGPAGPPGADGAAGPQGPAGADGAVGLQGPPGADGAAGPQGPAGADGAVGPQGPPGADGAVGAVGPQGPAGNDGAVGPVGPQGPSGAVGAAGPPGPAGAMGDTGPIGPQGATGDTGPKGPQGPAGGNGPLVAFNVGRAAGDQFVNGGVTTTVDFDNVVFNYGGGFNDDTNQFTPPIPGIYQYDVVVSIVNATAGQLVQFWINQAGTNVAQTVVATTGGRQVVTLSATWDNSTGAPYGGGPFEVKTFLTGGTMNISRFDSVYSGHLVIKNP